VENEKKEVKNRTLENIFEREEIGSKIDLYFIPDNFDICFENGDGK
jgi:hypothetical protein